MHYLRRQTISAGWNCPSDGHSHKIPVPGWHLDKPPWFGSKRFETQLFPERFDFIGKH